jgi:ABC-type nitrate/sulfonate/bicarbonate transport system substrate-binding protein
MLTINNFKVEDVSLVPVGFDVQPLLTGQVDVLTGLVTNQGIALEGADEKIGYAPCANLGFAFYWNTPFAIEETLSSKKELLVAWLRATARGWEYAIKFADEVAKFVVEKYGEGLKLDNQLIELKRETASPDRLHEAEGPAVDGPRRLAVRPRDPPQPHEATGEARAGQGRGDPRHPGGGRQVRRVISTHSSMEG